MRRAQHGFTMTEIVVTLLIIGVGIGLFSSVFISNWGALEDRIKRANLATEASQLFEQMSIDGRNSRSIDVTATAISISGAFTNAVDNSVVTYSISDTGTITRAKGATIKIFSTHGVLADSNFTKNGKNLLINLRLKDDVFMRPIHITTSIEILPRN